MKQARKSPTGYTAAINAFILANPGATSAEIKEHVAGDDMRLRKSVASILTQQVQNEVLRVELSPGRTPGRPLRRFWLIDRGPMTGRRRGKVGRPPPSERPATTAANDPEDVEPRKPTWPPAEAQHHEPELRRPLPAVQANELELAVIARHVITEGGHPALQFTIPVHSYLELLRRYR